MLAFGLKITWFCLSLSGLVGCWVTLLAFGRAVGSYWGPVVYCVGCTLMQGIFCLGLIWRMDPFRMPRGFCVAQSIIIGYAAFLMTGVAAAFSYATSLSALKPKSWSQGGKGALVWRRCYICPIVVFPVVATVILIAVTVRFDKGEQSDNLLCDYNNPLWIRFLSYAGGPVIVGIPCVYLSILSIVRISRTNKHLERSRNPDMDIDHFTAMPRRPREVHIARAISASSPTSNAARSSRREAVSPALSSPTLTSTRGFHMPFQPPDLSLDTLGSSVSSSPESDAPDSPVSSSFPTFANPPHGTTSIDPDGITITELTTHPKEDWREILGPSCSPDLDKRSSMKWQEDGDKMKFDEDEDATEDNHLETYSTPRIARTKVGPMARKSRRPLPTLSPAVWRILVFQICFTLVQPLACITTLIDVVQHRPPSAFGTQHVALILTAWGPVFIFGHIPVLRTVYSFWLPRK